MANLPIDRKQYHVHARDIFAYFLLWIEKQTVRNWNAPVNDTTY
jgi:hypothetical protein